MAVVVLWVLAIGVAFGQGFDAHGPSLPPDIASVDDPIAGAAGGRTGAPTFSVVTQVASAPLVERIIDAGLAEERPVLGSLVGLELSGVAQVKGPVGLGVTLPTWLLLDGQAQNGFTLGDITVWGPTRLLYTETLRLGVVPFVVLPTGAQARFLGEPGVGGGGLVSSGLRASVFAAHLDLGLDGTPASDVDEWPGGAYFRYAAAAGVVPNDTLGLHAELRSRFPLVSAAPTLPSELLGTVKARPMDRLWITTSAGSAVTRGVGAAELRVLIGIATAPGDEPVEIAVDEGPGKRQIHVIDSRRFPLSGAVVTVGSQERETDHEGYATLSGRIVYRNPQLHIERHGFEPTTLEVDPDLEWWEVALTRVPVPLAVSIVGPSGVLELSDAQLEGPYDAGAPEIDEAGVFHWALRPGVWSVTMSSPGLGEQARTIVIEEDRADPIRVDAVLTSLVNDHTLVRVAVVDRLGRPVEDAVVALGDRDIGTTGTGGDVTVKGLEVGHTTFVVRSERFGADTAVDHNVHTGEQTIEAVLDWLPGSVQVRVDDGQGFPVPATVRFFGPADLPARQLDDRGDELFVLRAGTWDLEVTAPGMGAQRRRVITTAKPGQLAVVHVTLLPTEDGPSTLELRVVDADGEPQGNVGVKLDGRAVGSTGPTGNIVLEGLHPGIRQVRVEGEQLVASVHELELVPGRQVEDVTMSWIDGVVDLYVVDHDDRPVDAKVALRGRTALTPIFTGLDGYERIILPTGPWDLEFTSGDLVTESRGIMIVENGRRRIEMRVRLGPDEGDVADVSVEVVGPDGAPVPEAEVRIDGRRLERAVDGVARAEDVPRGTHSVQVRAEGMVPTTVETEVGDEGAQLEVALDWAPGAVEVRVADEDGVPVDATVTLHGPTSHPPRETEGGKLLVAAKPGRWFLTVASEGKRSEEIPVDLPAEGALTEVDVALEAMPDGTPARVLIQVETPEGVAVADAEVVIDGQSAGRTTGAGTFEIDAFTAPTAEVEVLPGPGYEAVTVPVARPRARDRGEEIRHRLVVEHQPQEIEVAVADVDGAPVEAEVIAVRGAHAVAPVVVREDGTGAVALRPGTYTITARTQAGETATREVVVAPAVLAAARADGAADGVAEAEEAPRRRVTLVVAQALSDLRGDRLVPPRPIEFDLDASQLRPELGPVLDDLHRWLSAHPEVASIEVGGHTDNQGGVAYNQGLSERRARTIEAELLRRGVAEERLMSRGYGLSRPITANLDAESRQRNRRVELTVLEWASDR